MNADQGPEFLERSRAQARTSARLGLGSLAHALNHCNNALTAYRYTAAAQARFADLAAELVELIEHGEIEGNPAHGPHLELVAARGDKALQAVLQRASSPAPIRSTRSRK